MMILQHACKAHVVHPSSYRLKYMEDNSLLLLPAGGVTLLAQVLEVSVFGIGQSRLKPTRPLLGKVGTMFDID